MCIRDRKKNTLNQLDSNDNSDRVSGEKVQQNIKNNPANNKQNTEQQSYNQSIGYTQSSNNEKHQQTSQEQNGNIKFPMNSEIPNQYITGDVAKALDKKTKIEQQASKDNEKGIISDAESIRRQKKLLRYLIMQLNNNWTTKLITKKPFFEGFC